MNTACLRVPAVGEAARAARTVPALLSWRSDRQPERIAIEVHGAGEPLPGGRAQVATLTFGEWDARATAVAAALVDRGLTPGARVALRFPARDWIDFAVAYCGVQRAGGVAVPLSDRLVSTQLSRVLAHCSAAVLIHGAAAVAELVAAGRRRPPAEVRVRPGDLAQILYTSGTTGAPKGVAASHANLAQGAPTDPRRLPLGHSERFLHAFPIGTNAAQTMLFNALRSKPAALTLAAFTPRRFGRLIESSRAGTVFVVPSMAVELLNSGALRERDCSGVHLIGSTAAPLPPAVAVRLAEALPRATIVNYYTSTEAAPAQTSMVFDPDRPEAVGRAVDGALRIADAAGVPLPTGAVGDVWMRCRYPRAYFRDDAASTATFCDDWVRMGDVGRIDDDGYLYLLDRESDVVKSGAYRVSTLEVEAALYEHPAVAEAAAVGLPHPVLGATIAVALVAGPGSVAADLALPALRAFLATRLADYQLPTRVLVLDRLPRNEGGKVRKGDLRARFAQPHPYQEAP